MKIAPAAPLSSGACELRSRQFEVIDWAIESLEFRLQSAARELDRFAIEAGRDEGHLAWSDPLAAGLLLIEAQFQDLLSEGLPPDFTDWEALARALLHHSDWLLVSADEATERFGDERLSLRLIGLAGACFEIARWIPAGERIQSPTRNSSPVAETVLRSRSEALS